MKKIILFIVALTCFSLFAKEEGLVRSIEWQKVELQERVTKKVSQAVGAIIDKKDFIVEVDLAVSIPPAPNFDNKSNYQARVSNSEFEKAAKDYIVFSKLGLEVPVLAKAKDTEKEKLKDMWKFNETNDIFKNLDSVTIFLYLDKNLTTSTVDAVKTILNNLKLPIGDLTAEVEIEQINLTNTKAVEPVVPQEKTLDDYLNYVSKFSVMLGIILSTMLFCIAAFFLFRKYKEMKENEQAKEMISNASQKLDEEKEEKDKANDFGGMPGMPAGELGEDAVGIDRFKRFLGKSSMDASLLVKKWIKDDSKDSELALNALVQQLDNEQLFIIFESLTIDERTDWKSLLKGSLSGGDLKKANDYISNEIVSDIIVPPLFQDKDLLDTLLNINAAEGAKFVKENPNFGGVLMNIINTRFIADIMTKLSTDETQNVIRESLEFTADQTQGIFEDFKNTLAEYKTKRVQKPFVKRIIEIIPIAKPAMEVSLYKALAESQEVEAIKVGAGSYFPSFLIEELTDNVLREVIQAYPVKKKVELLSLENGELNVRLVRLFAPEGSKARDLLDIEMQSIEDDLTVQKKIREQKDVIWEEFVNHTRSIIKEDKSLAAEVDETIETWIGKLVEGEEVTETTASHNEEVETDNVVEFNRPEADIDDEIDEMPPVAEIDEDDDDSEVA